MTFSLYLNNPYDPSKPNDYEHSKEVIAKRNHEIAMGKQLEMQLAMDREKRQRELEERYRRYSFHVLHFILT